MLHIAFYSRNPRPGLVKPLRQMPQVRLYEPQSSADLIALAPKAQVFVINDPPPAEGLQIANALKQPGCAVRWVQILSAGVDGLMQHGVPAGIAVTSQGGALSAPVAEHAVGLLLGMSRQLFEIGVRSRAGQWNRVFNPPIAALEGGTVLIVGMGNIGREVAKRLRAFDMHIIGMSRKGAPDAAADEMVALSELHVALPKADGIVISIALTPETRNLFDAATLTACKRGALLVNVSRGEVVDQAALKAALDSGILGGAGIDVTSPEPLPAGDPLWHSPNLVVSPHIAAAGSTRASQRITQAVLDNLDRFVRGQALLHQVN